MLKIHKLSKAFGEKSVLKDVSFDFPAASVTAITGPSGTGKTTLINLILGLAAPDSGQIFGLKGAKLAAVFQEDRLIEHMSAFENVRLVTDGAVDADQIRQALTSVGLDAGSCQSVSRYSGGMKRRVAIVRAVLARPDILILDEPFKGLDEAIKADCARFILDMCPQATILLITHDAEEAHLMRSAASLCLG